MHISERLGLNKGRPVTIDENEILAAFERLFINEDVLFLRWGSSITLTSDYGVTMVSVARADRFSAKVLFVMVPPGTLAPGLVKTVIASASAKQETKLKLVVLERRDQPLMVVSEVEIDRPFSLGNLNAMFSDFSFVTELALGEAIRALEKPQEWADATVSEFRHCS